MTNLEFPNEMSDEGFIGRIGLTKSCSTFCFGFAEFQYNKDPNFKQNSVFSDQDSNPNGGSTTASRETSSGSRLHGRIQEDRRRERIGRLIPFSLTQIT